MSGLVLVAAFGAVVDALVVEMAVAQPTHTSASTPVFRFPQVTAPPSVHELIRRQEAQTFLVGPDNTCGYVNGLSSEAYYCRDSAALCAFMTYSTTGARACCNLSTCGFVMDCVNYRQIRTSSACDSECMRNDLTLKCSNAATPYCGTVTFFSGIQDYYCMATPYSSVESIYTTWVGQNDGRRFTPLLLTMTTGNPDPFGTESARGGGGSVVNTAGSGRLSGTPVPGATASSSPPSNHGSGGGGSSNTGAIVGGVVGGIAILALVGLGIFFIVRHGRNRDRPAAGPPPPMAEDAPYPPPGPDGSTLVSPHASVLYHPNHPPPPPGGPGGYVPSASPPPPSSDLHHQQQQQPGYAPAPAYYAADAPPAKTQTQPYSHAYAVPPSPASPPPPSASPTATEGGGAPAPLSQNPSGGGGGYPLQEQHQHQHQQQQAPYNTMSTASTVFYESGGDVVGARGPHANHRGQFHEMG